MADFELRPRGPFVLASAARFIGGWPPAARSWQGTDEEVVRLGFLVDDWTGHAGLTLRQRADGTVTVTVAECTAADPRRACVQAARIVSLDHDGSGYAALGERDAVIGRLQRAADWLRPVLFHSPYEAACWAVISARLRQPVAARVRDRLAAEHGRTLQVEGEALFGFPSPERLLAVRDADGIPERKLTRLHAIAEAALAGRLDREPLLALDQEAAVARLRELPGIGPFWADGIYLRAVGPTDGLTLQEPRLRAKAAVLYDAPAATEEDAAFRTLAERWRPFRTWVTVLMRAAG